MSARSGDGIKRICQRNLTPDCKGWGRTLGWIKCPACGQPYTDDDVVPLD